MQKSSSINVELEVHQCGVSDQNKVMCVMESIAKVDVLINCTRVAYIGKAHGTSKEEFNRIFRTNANGVYNMLHACIPRMMNQKYGCIIKISSIATVVGLEQCFAYSASKGAMAAMTLSVAKDYIEYNIRCNSISLGEFTHHLLMGIFEIIIRVIRYKCLRNYPKLNHWVEC